jgi:hypothetical protein
LNKSRATLPSPVKAEVHAKAKELIETGLKPKHIRPPPKDAMFNYVTDITTKWLGSKLYFIAIYACPSPNAISPTFEGRFARMEFVGDGKFALSFMRHTEQWIVLYERLSLGECLKAIKDDPWFVP